MIQAVLHRQRLAVLIRVIPDVMGGCAVAAMLWAALASSEVSTAEAAEAIAALGMVVQKMRELGSVWNRYCAWTAAKNRCLVLLNVQPLQKKRRSTAKQKKKAKTEPRVHIRLAQVHASELRGGCQRPKDADIEAIAVRYGLAALMERLGGIQGRITENGRNLSAGELRRIFWARAALCQADLLLLDDPAASLDAAGRALERQLVQESQGTVVVSAPDSTSLPPG